MFGDTSWACNSRAWVVSEKVSLQAHATLHHPSQLGRICGAAIYAGRGFTAIDATVGCLFSLPCQMKTLRTRRLVLREVNVADAAFLVCLMNETGYLRMIGDKGVRTALDACDYLSTAAIYNYRLEHLGFNIVEVTDTQVQVGICGLVRRESDGEVELGYAISDLYSGQGYATEAAAATRDHAHGELGFSRLSATTLIENLASRKVIKKIGMSLQEVSNPDDNVRVICRYVSFKAHASRNSVLR